MDKNKKNTIDPGILETAMDKKSSGPDQVDDRLDTLDNDKEFISNDSDDVSPSERKLIDDAFDPVSTEDEPIDDLALDNKDENGELLNEKGLERHLFGDDLDMELEKEEDEE